jgi:putative transposase
MFQLTAAEYATLMLQNATSKPGRGGRRKLPLAFTAFVESLFRTAKYRPEFPENGFSDLQEARHWASAFVHWYNNIHKHSCIRYVSPAQRHAGDDREILAARHEVYVQAKSAHPRRWTRHTRNWNPITVVTLNPERDSAMTAAENAAQKPRTAA